MAVYLAVVGLFCAIESEHSGLALRGGRRHLAGSERSFCSYPLSSRVCLGSWVTWELTGRSADPQHSLDADVVQRSCWPLWGGSALYVRVRAARAASDVRFLVQRHSLEGGGCGCKTVGNPQMDCPFGQWKHGLNPAKWIARSANGSKYQHQQSHILVEFCPIGGLRSRRGDSSLGSVDGSWSRRLPSPHGVL